jgi:hypothetical protein
MAPVCLRWTSPIEKSGFRSGNVSVSPRVTHDRCWRQFPAGSQKVGHHKDEGRRLGKRREEDNFPASHGNKRESELTLPYGYPSWEEEEEGLKEKERRKKKKANDE